MVNTNVPKSHVRLVQCLSCPLWQGIYPSW